MSDFNLLLLAAGLGTRLRPATLSTPKPSIPFFSIPMGYYLWPYLSQTSIDKFVVNTFHLPEVTVQTYNELSKYINKQILFSHEFDFIKGNGGALKSAESLFTKDKPILLANADEIFFTLNLNFINELFQKHLSTNAFATLTVIKHKEAGHKFGAIWCDESGRVKGIGKDSSQFREQKLIPYHFIGLQFLSYDLLNFIELNKEQNVFYDVLIHHLNDKLIQIFEIQADWYETGNLEDYLLAQKEILLKKDKEIYKQFFSLLNPLPHSKLSDLTK